MISKIHLENIATYKSATDLSLTKFNFIYGANGTGKTTISEVLYQEMLPEKCCVDWNTDTHERLVVYNPSFVKANFQNRSEVKGIFTLGENSIKDQETIKKRREELDDAIKTRDAYNKSIENLNCEIADLKRNIYEKCWSVHKEHRTEFSEALKGFQQSKEKFGEKCIASLEDPSDTEQTDIEEIRLMYKAAFAKDAIPDAKYTTMPMLDIAKLDNHKLLGTAIVGKNDSAIGTFIQYLNASDWVKKGIEYAHAAQGKCPYCHRDMPQDIQQEIEDYFDEQYELNKNKVITYANNYVELHDSIKTILDNIDTRQLSYLKYDKFNVLKEKIFFAMDKNLMIVRKKIEALAECVEIESIVDLANEINNQIIAFNDQIDKNNAVVKNQKVAQNNCKETIWKFFAQQCKNDIIEFKKQLKGKEDGEKTIKEKCRQLENHIQELDGEIRITEARLTSDRPAIDAINKILAEFGFTGFFLAENEKTKGAYKIVRPSGEDVGETLSEGEQNFIAFLYFYHLCFGSQNEVGVSERKIVVIDDPVSSLDSNVLFIVATLVKKILQDCKHNDEGITQVIILTHNVYFHKEITHWGRKDALPSKETKYFILRKQDEQTSIEFYGENPVSTSYELMWEELNSENVNSTATILNVMRRILEHYFSIIGGIDYEKCINTFDGENKLICKSLISFINEGSHEVFDDFVFAQDVGNIETYKHVFRMIFEQLGQKEHYDMMMEKTKVKGQ